MGNDERPNQLLIVSDEERRNDWLRGKVELPAHQRLMDDGLTFNRYYTHASPCSPSRASLYTGSYVAQHGVVPLIMKVPGMTEAGTETDALATHVDLATTLCALGGVDVDDSPTLSGVDLSPALADPSASPRDYVFFSQDAAQSDLISHTRYAVRGFFDGETKYARYYGIGGGIDGAGKVDEREDHDHEWYEPAEDPHELINLANDVGRKDELREHFNRLLEIELAELGDKAGHGGPS